MSYFEGSTPLENKLIYRLSKAFELRKCIYALNRCGISDKEHIEKIDDTIDKLLASNDYESIEIEKLISLTIEKLKQYDEFL